MVVVVWDSIAVMGNLVVLGVMYVVLLFMLNYLLSFFFICFHTLSFFSDGEEY